MARRMRTTPYWEPHSTFHTPFGGTQNRKGHLYYVRLMTGYGTLYKIGYTSLASVEARLTYKGPLTGCSIDRVLLFQYRTDAERLEQQLHGLLHHRACFTNHRGGPQFPLFRNGQSELYHTDVLGLDPSYCADLATRTNERLELQRHGIPDGSLRATVWKTLSRWLPADPDHPSKDRTVADLVARTGLADEVIPSQSGYAVRPKTHSADEVSGTWLDEVVAERKAAQAEVLAKIAAAAAEAERKRNNPEPQPGPTVVKKDKAA